MMEEFQDIDNFQMIPGNQQDDYHQNYENLPFDEGLEFESPMEMQDNRMGYSDTFNPKSQGNGLAHNYKGLGDINEIDSQVFPKGKANTYCSQED
jgi:hypothetical protein